jgi:hypothetical protein
MKMNRLFTNTCAGLAGASLWFAAISPRHADASETNAAASPASNSITFKISAGHENSPADNYYGLPKEAFDRLTPEQIVELAQAHQKTFVTEQLPETILTALVPAAMFTMIAVCVWLGVNGRQKRSRMLHDTIRLMIEKGQPIPPELLQPPAPKRRPQSDLRRGLVLAGIGVGLTVWLALDGGNKWALGLIPLLMGLGFLVTWKVEQNKNGDSR